MHAGPLIIVSGPSGSGKSTLIRDLLQNAPWPLRLSVSVTTRPPRPGEQDGVAYHFWQRERFEQELGRAGFLEWAEVFGNYYGTLKREVAPYRAQGQGVLLEIDVQGREQVKRIHPEAVAVFIRTSSLETYEKRLRERGTESEAAIERRLKGARIELPRAAEYDHQVINDDFDQALAELRRIVNQLFVH
jgi:guanylate kinase